MKEFQGRIFAGFLIIAVGTLFLLGSLDVIDAGDVIGDYWPVILIVIGLWQMGVSQSQNKVGGFILLLVGGFFLLNNLDVFDFNLWHVVWPLAIILVGLWLITKPFFRQAKSKVPGIEADDLDAFVLFSGLDRRIKSQNFRGGKASVIFGGLELDFHDAGLEGNQATIEVSVLFGGADISVPRDWKVVVDSTAVLGAVEDKHRSVAPEESAVTLYIKASAVFGGVEIKN